MILDAKLVKQILPQKEPFCFINSVDKIDIESQSIICNYCFELSNPMLGRDNSSDIFVPKVLLIESVAQSSILLLSIDSDKDVKVSNNKGKYLLSKVENMVFRSGVHPGHNIKIYTTLNRKIAKFHFFSARVYNELEEKILEGDFVVYLENEYDR